MSATVAFVVGFGVGFIISAIIVAAVKMSGRVDDISEAYWNGYHDAEEDMNDKKNLTNN